MAFACAGAAWSHAVRAEDAAIRGTPVAPTTRPTSPAAERDGISVFFSPRGGCTEAVIANIAMAKKTLKVQAYYVTSAPIAKAVSDAKKRGVEVTVLLDKSQQTAKYSSATFFFNSGIPTFIDARHAIAHNKIILIDDGIILTGSFNFTKAAEESNAENLIIIRNKPELMAAYQRNFDEHLKHAIPYEGLAAGARDDAKPPPTNPAEQDEANKPTEGVIEVHVTKAGTKYHVSGCRFLSESDITMTLDEAKAKGLTPCSRCHPPE